MKMYIDEGEMRDDLRDEVSDNSSELMFEEISEIRRNLANRICS